MAIPHKFCDAGVPCDVFKIGFSEERDAMGLCKFIYEDVTPSQEQVRNDLEKANKVQGYVDKADKGISGMTEHGPNEVAQHLSGVQDAVSQTNNVLTTVTDITNVPKSCMEKNTYETVKSAKNLVEGDAGSNLGYLAGKAAELGGKAAELGGEALSTACELGAQTGELVVKTIAENPEAVELVTKTALTVVTGGAL